MNQLSAIKPKAVVPARPIRHQDEWAETYLGRAAREMGVRRPWRGDLEVLRPLLPSVALSDVDGRPRYASESLPAWSAPGRGAQIRVCPQCFEEERYIRQRWRSSFLTVCTRHHLVLKDGLVEPAITAYYKRPGRRTAYEATLDEVRDGATCPTPVGLQYALSIWKPFEDAVISNAHPDTMSSSQCEGQITHQEVSTGMNIVEPGSRRCGCSCPQTGPGFRRSSWV